VLLVAGIAVVVLAAGGPAGYGRYRLPATPIECVLAAIGCAALLDIAPVKRLLRRSGERVAA
jgi:hypothetical protein